MELMDKGGKGAMAENVTLELPGEMAGSGNDKRGFQKYVTEAEQVLQQLRSGSGAALLLGALSSRRPWTQFVATDNFKTPASLPRLTRRFYRNVDYFQANYLFIFLGLFAYCLITTPLLLLAVLACFFGYRKLTAGPNTWKVAGWEVTKPQQYSLVAAASVALCWLAGAGAALFWVIGASVTVVALHAGLYDAETLPQDPEQFPALEQV